jgi:hypothetical protein
MVAPSGHTSSVSCLPHGGTESRAPLEPPPDSARALRRLDVRLSSRRRGTSRHRGSPNPFAGCSITRPLPSREVSPVISETHGPLCTDLVGPHPGGHGAKGLDTHSTTRELGFCWMLDRCKRMIELAERPLTVVLVAAEACAVTRSNSAPVEAIGE